MCNIYMYVCVCVLSMWEILHFQPSYLANNDTNEMLLKVQFEWHIGGSLWILLQCIKLHSKTVQLHTTQYLMILLPLSSCCSIVCASYNMCVFPLYSTRRRQPQRLLFIYQLRRWRRKLLWGQEHGPVRGKTTMALSLNVHWESNLGTYQKTVQPINVECLNLIHVAYDLWYKKFAGMETQEDTSIRSAGVKKTI